MDNVYKACNTTILNLSTLSKPHGVMFEETRYFHNDFSSTGLNKYSTESGSHFLPILKDGRVNILKYNHQ